MIIEWVLTDMKISEDVLCNLIKRSRRIVTEEFFKENDH